MEKKKKIPIEKKNETSRFHEPQDWKIRDDLINLKFNLSSQ